MTREQAIDCICERRGERQMRGIIAAALEHLADDVVSLLAGELAILADEVVSGELRGLLFDRAAAIGLAALVRDAKATARRAAQSRASLTAMIFRLARMARR